MLSHRRIKWGGVICQDCGLLFQKLSHYKQHVQSMEHKKQLQMLFKAAPPCETVRLPHIKVFAHTKDPGMAEALMGLHLITMCYSSGSTREPLYLCHTCQEKCSNGIIMCHLSSPEHRFSCLASRRPYQLRFGWISCLDAVTALKPSVVQMKEDTGPLMLLDMPEKVFDSAKKSPYFHIMKDIFRQKLPEKFQVEKMQRVTLKEYIGHEKRTQPVLGLRSLVEYRDRECAWLCGYLCLICQRKLHQSQVIAHLIGFEHVFATLHHMLPDSTGDKDDFKQKVAQGSSQMLELAKQAVLVDRCKDLQDVKLDRDDFEKVDSLSFENALDKLQSHLREQKESPLQLPGSLTPPQTPAEEDLAPKPAVGVQPIQEPLSTQRNEQPYSSRPLLTEAREALQSFIEDPQRIEPVVGVGAVLQCCAEGQLPFYTCRACCVKMSQQAVAAHLTSCEHRYLYLKWQHPNCLSKYKETQDLEEKADHLRIVAQMVERDEGCGETQVLDLDATKYKEVFSKSVRDALNYLQATWRERYPKQSETEPLLNPELMLAAAKQEPVDSCLLPREPRQDPQSSAMSCGKTPEKKLPSLAGASQIPTQAYKALWDQLKIKRRRQPVIGLRTIVEYHEDNQTPYFMCETCGTKVPQGFIIGHLISDEHRYKYIKSRHPKLLNGWKDEADLSEYGDTLMAKAKFLEMTEGLGDIQIRKMGKDGFEQVFLPSTEQVKAEPSPDPDLSVAGSPKKDGKAVCVKEECVESCITPPAATLGPASAPGPTVTVSVKQAPCPSSKVLWDFVKSPNRTEPIVGLSLMMQFFSEDLLPYYTCEICELRMSKGHIIGHIISHGHRLTYMKSRHPDLLECGVGGNLGQDKVVKMKKMAKNLEAKEGPGKMKILKLDQSLYRKVVSAPTHEALKLLQVAWDQWSGPVPVDEQTPGSTTRTLTETFPPGPPVSRNQATPPTSTQGINKDAWPYNTPRPATTPSIFSSKYSHLKAASILGLSGVIECQPGKGCPFYVCKCCATKLAPREVFNHVNSTSHCLAYLKDRYSIALPRSDIQKLLKAEGPGTILVMRLDFPDYQRVHRMAAKEALDELQLIWKKQFQKDHLPSGTQQVENKGTCSQMPQPPVQDQIEPLATGEPIPHPPLPVGELPSYPHGEDRIKSPALKELNPITHVEGLTPNLLVGQDVSPQVAAPMPGDETIQRRVMLPSPALDPQLLHIKAAAADESHLSKFLLPFRCTKKQPVIGLRKVLEYRSFKQPTLYLCLSCGEKVDNVHICRHVTGWRHQYSYMRAEHPYLLQGLEDNSNVGSRMGLLMKLAEVVENQEGAGQAQVKKLDPVMYQEVAAADFHTALEKLDVSRGHTQPGMCFASSRETFPQAARDESVHSQEEPSPVGGAPQSPNEGQDGDTAEDRRVYIPVQALEDQVAALGEGEDLSVVGLQVVMECRCVDDESRPYVYLCQVCSLKLEEDSALEHICSSLHHYHYITSQRSWALEAEKVKKSLYGISDLLKLAAARLKRSEGHGRVQVVELPEGLFRRLVDASYEHCMTMIKTGNTPTVPGDSVPAEQDRGAQGACGSHGSGLMGSISSATGASTATPGGTVSVLANDPPVHNRPPAAGAVVKPLRTSVTQKCLDPSSNLSADHPSLKTESHSSLASPRCSDVPPIHCSSPFAVTSDPPPSGCSSTRWSTSGFGDGQAPVHQDCSNMVSGVSRSSSHENLSSTLPGIRCSTTNGSSTSNVECGECGCGPHRRTVVPLEDGQKIKDLIMELIFRKEIIDKELSGSVQWSQGTVDTGCPGDRTAEDGPLSTVSCVAGDGTSSGVLKRKRDPFSYDNQQFATGAPLQDRGCPLERRFQESMVQQSLRRTMNVEVESQLGFTDPHMSPCYTVAEHCSAVTAVNTSAVCVVAQESHQNPDPDPPAVTPLPSGPSSTSSSTISSQMLRKCSGKLQILENYLRSTPGAVPPPVQGQATGCVSDRKRPRQTSNSSVSPPVKILGLDGGSTEHEDPGDSAH